MKAPIKTSRKCRIASSLTLSTTKFSGRISGRCKFKLKRLIQSIADRLRRNMLSLWFVSQSNLWKTLRALKTKKTPQFSLNSKFSSISSRLQIVLSAFCLTSSILWTILRTALSGKTISRKISMKIRLNGLETVSSQTLNASIQSLRFRATTWRHFISHWLALMPIITKHSCWLTLKITCQKLK